MHSTVFSRQVPYCRLRVRGEEGCAYVMLEDVARDEGFIDARVFVRAEVLQRIF
jgi:hypothetical protein